LNLSVFENKIASYGMMVTLFLSVDKGICEMSTPSSEIVPLSNSITLDKHKLMVLFPAPVLPTIPIFSPELI
jgi:hypothetical protein